MNMELWFSVINLFYPEIESQFLKNLTQVLRYTFAEQNQGGHGATIAELKQ